MNTSTSLAAALNRYKSDVADSLAISENWYKMLYLKIIKFVVKL